MWAKASPNIAFVKYWGKRPQDARTRYEERNFPLATSISMTLQKAASFCKITEQKKGASEVFFQGTAADLPFQEKTLRHVEFVAKNFERPFTHLKIETFNNFPHSQGFASSASGFTALTLATLDFILGQTNATKFVIEKNSEFSALCRAGSGSAARSVAGPFMSWNDKAATRLPFDWKLYDTVIQFGTESKTVSSSIGHQRAIESPFFEARLKEIPGRIELAQKSLDEQNISQLGMLLELEALELHAMALTSRPPIFYLNEKAWSFVSKLSQIENRNFFFTLDAGSSVHLISQERVRTQIDALLKEWNLEAPVWEDCAGFGPSFVEKPEELSI